MNSCLLFSPQNPPQRLGGEGGNSPQRLGGEGGNPPQRLGGEELSLGTGTGGTLPGDWEGRVGTLPGDWEGRVGLEIHAQCKHELMSSVLYSEPPRRLGGEDPSPETGRGGPLPGDWEGRVGLEIHAQISSNSKLFSGSQVQFSAPPNSLVSPLDASLPGTLPAGYQITQQRLPLAVNGHLTFDVYDESRSQRQVLKSCQVRIKQLQLEQDSGKSLHDQENGEVLVDLNRAGVALMEIVTEPDMVDGAEAAAMVKELQLILQSLRTCDGNMSEGSMRVDANISVSRSGEELGTRAEVKNINSAKFVQKAIEYEMQRQIQVLEGAGEVEEETRYFDWKAGKTISLRDKEQRHDYRYMPEPNLPPLILYTDATSPRGMEDAVVNIDRIREQMRELPDATRRRLVEEYGIQFQHSVALVGEGLVEYFESLVDVKGKGRDPRSATSWVLTDLLEELHKRSLTFQECPVTASKLGEIMDIVAVGTISKSTGKKILGLQFDGDNRSLSQVIDEHQWAQIRDEETLGRICEDILEKHPELVDAYRKGNKKVVNRLMGEVQKATNKCADPTVTSRLLKKKLEGH
ncbi:glutamyl-tRNA(Gln) amidotransferase subunit B, mitochondrial-like [Branchiostoma floridae]|uniref:Glutamyl-tRNA(Gln) amidotransferase subunit B, mitochondrial n=1 Tax=Branchiostoma floridae TaxID=7739 RepID=A0A9J7LHC8_BRAFL|nr:glutamyl-tRNA(Gln) amidotransferase subunit B, mitochondrial-like [Branchiostoma floridae]